MVESKEKKKKQKCSSLSHFTEKFDLENLYDRTKMFAEGNIFKKKLTISRTASRSIKLENKVLYLFLSLH